MLAKIDSLLRSENEFWVRDELDWKIVYINFDESKFLDNNFEQPTPKNFTINDENIETLYNYKLRDNLTVSKAKEINSSIEKIKKEVKKYRDLGYKTLEECDCEKENSETQKIELIKIKQGDLKEAEPCILYKKSE